MVDAAEVWRAKRNEHIAYAIVFAVFVVLHYLGVPSAALIGVSVAMGLNIGHALNAHHNRKKALDALKLRYCIDGLVTRDVQ